MALCKEGFSEQWIATQINMSQGAIHLIKKGHVKKPRDDTAEKLEKLYFQLVATQ
jgi:ribosome-binding protein aMBF1 (putative translation factor)